MSEREFTGSHADTPIDELREIVKRGVNIHIPTSGAAVAKENLMTVYNKKCSPEINGLNILLNLLIKETNHEIAGAFTY